jgi:vacuolar-type H+-ATPase subunit E/Vma4
MKALGSPAAVAAAVGDDADAEVDRIEREARAALARIAEEEAKDPAALPEREVRLAAARREAHERRAREDLLDARESLEAREAWIHRAEAEGRRLLAEPAPAADRRAAIARLVQEGLDRLPGDTIVVAVAPADAPLLDEAWARALSPGRAVRVVPEEGVSPGGAIVRSADGKVAFDDTLEARARRFEAAWRSALGALYEAAGRGA